MPNVFLAKRRELSRKEGQHLSDWRIAMLLGLQPKHVYTLSRANDEQIRPAYLLALEYAIENGLEACEEIIDPPKEHFAQVVSEIQMQKKEISEMLGIRRGQLWRLCNIDDQTIHRSYILAAYYLHQRYGPDEVIRAHREHARRYRSGEE